MSASTNLLQSHANLLVWSLVVAAVLGMADVRTASALAPDRNAAAINKDDSSLAAGGYDVVAYFPEGGGTPTKGKKDFSFDYSGVTYRFATRQNLERFKAEPDKYEPAHGGWCSWAMAAKGEKVEVDPKSFVIQDGRLLLFYKDLFNDTRKDWLKKQTEYLPKADASWKKLSGESARTGEARAQRTLQAQLDAKRAEFETKASPEQVAAYNKGVDDVAASSVMQTALRVGAKAPDFDLPNATGQRVKLADLLKQGPVVLTWYRGGWCPYCNIQLHAYQEVLTDIETAGGKLVAISPELPDQSLSTREKNALKFEVLSDSGNTVARSYGLAYKLPDDLIARFKGRLDLPKFNGDESWELPLGATYVVARDGTITYAFVDADYRKRAEPAAIVEAVKAAVQAKPASKP